MALNSLFCADVPLSNYSLTHSFTRVPAAKWARLGDASYVSVSKALKTPRPPLDIRTVLRFPLL